MKMLAVKFIAAEIVPPNTHTRSFVDVTVVAENTVTSHVGTSLNYA